MKIIYITEQIYIHGGAEKILTQKLNHWADIKKYEVLLITTEQNNNEPCYQLSEKVKHIDLNIGYDRKLSYFKWYNLSKFPKHYSKLSNEIKKFKPNAIFLISLSWIRFFLPIIARKYPIYNEYHTSYYGFQKGFKNAPFYLKVKRTIANMLIICSEYFYTNIIFLNQDEFDHYNRKNGVIIPNFFDNHMTNHITTKKNQVISLGRMSEQKGYDLLIESWLYLDNKISGWTLNVYGDGSDKEKLQTKINNHTFKNKIEIKDAVSDVSKILAESKLYAMSSRYETFPMVLLEALSNGLPVVSFDCPTGPRNILINKSDGLLAKPYDTKDLAEKLLELMNNDKLREQMSENGKSNISRFNEEFVMKSWDKLIIKNSI